MSIQKYLATILSPRNIKKVTLELLWGSDTKTIRMILAVASLMFSIEVFTQEDVLRVHPAWKVTWQLAPLNVWAAAFMLHFVGLSWRFLDIKRRVNWALAINAFGLLIWTASTLAFSVSTWKSFHTVAPSTALEFTVCMFAAWALIRTGQTT